MLKNLNTMLHRLLKLHENFFLPSSKKAFKLVNEHHMPLQYHHRSKLGKYLGFVECWRPRDAITVINLF